MIRRSLALLLFLALPFGTTAAAQTVGIGTSTPGSFYHSLGSAVAKVIATSTGIQARVQPFSSAGVYFPAINGGDLQFGFGNIYEMYLGMLGEQHFKGHKLTHLRLISIMSPLRVGLFVKKASAIKTIADLKGKRVAWVIGAPSLNQNITAMLAFANLTWNDVKKVEFGGFAGAMQGIVNNQVDAAWSSSVSGRAYEIAKSPRGLVYPVAAHGDKEGWKRVHAIAPFINPAMGTAGANLSKDQRAESSTYPYPILMTYASQDATLVYNMTKAMVETFDLYKDSAPGANGWAAERQNFEWVVPYHEGAIRYWKEAGKWTSANQVHNDMLIKRQKVLASAWAFASAILLPRKMVRILVF